jgi:hypothetical protein
MISQALWALRESKNVVIINVHVQNFECNFFVDLQLIWHLTCSNSKLNLFKSIMPRNSHLEISFIAKPPFQHIYPYAFSTSNLWKIDILALKRAWVASYDETIDPNNLIEDSLNVGRTRVAAWPKLKKTIMVFNKGSKTRSSYCYTVVIIWYLPMWSVIQSMF